MKELIKILSIVVAAILIGSFATSRKVGQDYEQKLQSDSIEYYRTEYKRWKHDAYRLDSVLRFKYKHFDTKHFNEEYK